MPSEQVLRELLGFAHRLADASGEVIRPYFRTSLDVVDKKDKGEGKYSPVTIADKAAEAAIRALIKAAYPDHGILGEEHGHENPGAELTWVIDPIDGTKAFIIGVPVWGTLIALNAGGRAVLGVLDQPFLGERYAAGPDGTYLGDRKLATRACPDLAEARLCCTEPGMFAAGAEWDGFERLTRRVALTRYGTDCYAYGLMAQGFVDLVVEAGLSPWDVQAVIPIVERAGGVVTDWEGGPAETATRVVAAGDPRLHGQVLKLLRAG
ncbi:histidinol-phosphatase [Hyphomicrobium sp.]|uniref:histidinol-phosphatase n=1 Tax=Hyphomicrobium sp. TaxID=82 RepID=UPI003D0A8CE3